MQTPLIYISSASSTLPVNLDWQLLEGTAPSLGRRWLSATFQLRPSLQVPRPQQCNTRANGQVLQKHSNAISANPSISSRIREVRENRTSNSSWEARFD